MPHPHETPPPHDTEDHCGPERRVATDIFDAHRRNLASLQEALCNAAPGSFPLRDGGDGEWFLTAECLASVAGAESCQQLIREVTQRGGRRLIVDFSSSTVSTDFAFSQLILLWRHAPPVKIVLVAPSQALTGRLSAMKLLGAFQVVNGNEEGTPESDMRVAASSTQQAGKPQCAQRAE
ncbi:MAG: hypothetical protein WC353_00510 [Candidatus Peribacter sp.]